VTPPPGSPLKIPWDPDESPWCFSLPFSEALEPGYSTLPSESPSGLLFLFGVFNLRKCQFITLLHSGSTTSPLADSPQDSRRPWLKVSPRLQFFIVSSLWVSRARKVLSSVDPLKVAFLCPHPRGIDLRYEPGGDESQTSPVCSPLWTALFFHGVLSLEMTFWPREEARDAIDLVDDPGPSVPSWVIFPPPSRIFYG